MGKLLYSVTMSLDGFIAGPEGDMSWLTPYLGPNPEVDALQEDIGALLVGNRTFLGDDPNRGTDKEGAFSGTWSGPVVVITHHPPDQPVAGTTFAASLAEGLAAARSAAGDHYVNILGADIARQCIEAGELDEVLTVIAPILLGDGVRLFERTGGPSIRLERVGVTELPHATNLWMRVLR